MRHSPFIKFRIVSAKKGDDSHITAKKLSDKSNYRVGGFCLWVTACLSNAHTLG